MFINIIIDIRVLRLHNVDWKSPLTTAYLLQEADRQLTIVKSIWESMVTNATRNKTVLQTHGLENTRDFKPFNIKRMEILQNWNKQVSWYSYKL